MSKLLKLFQQWSAVGIFIIIGMFVNTAHAAKYTFIHVLWSMQDVGVQWHIESAKTYMETHSAVEIKFIGPENYDPAEHAKFLDMAINSAPDGIAMHISSADALLPGLRKAKEAGIPFVSVTSHPPSAEDNAKMEGLYVSWVGADEAIVGTVVGERILKEGNPRRVAYLMAHLGHAGQEQRAQAFFDVMPDGTPGDKVAVGDEPQKAKDLLKAYLTKNPDADYLFGSTPMNKWVTDTLDELGYDHVKVLTSDSAPSSLECILTSHCLVSFSQQFPIQAPMAYEILYNWNETGMYPLEPMVVGPMIIDPQNAEAFKAATINVFGEDLYYDLSPY